MGWITMTTDTELNFGKVTKAISNFIRKQYPGCPIYLQYPESNFEMPSFVLRTSGGNMRPRISQDCLYRGITNERFTLEFYSLDIAEIQQVAFELRVLLDVVEADDGTKYRCITKNSMVAITENHVSLTFRVNLLPYIKKEPLPKMTNLSIQQEVIKD